MNAPARGAIVRVAKGAPIAREEAPNTTARSDQIVALVGAHEDRTGLLGQPGRPLVVWETRAGLARWAPADHVQVLDDGPHQLRPGRKRTGARTYGRGSYSVVYKPSCLCGWQGGNTDRAGAHSQFAEHIHSVANAAGA